MGAAPKVPNARLIELSGTAFNTVYPTDFGYWELVNELIQQEPPGSGDAELLGLLAAVGIIHGKSFDPDQRMRRILQEAVVIGNATARTVTFAPRAEEDVAYYPGSQRFNRLFEGGYQFLDPPPQVTAEGVVPTPSDGARKLNARTWMFYMATGITPAICMRLTGIGSQYLMATRGGDGKYLDGDRNYRLTLPPDVPRSRFYALRQPNPLHAPDRPTQTRPRQPDGHRRNNPDGWTDIYLGPTPPVGKTNNWLQTVPGKGFFTRGDAKIHHQYPSGAKSPNGYCDHGPNGLTCPVGVARTPSAAAH